MSMDVYIKPQILTEKNNRRKTPRVRKIQQKWVKMETITPKPKYPRQSAQSSAEPRVHISKTQPPVFTCILDVAAYRPPPACVKLFQTLQDIMNKEKYKKMQQTYFHHLLSQMPLLLVFSALSCAVWLCDAPSFLMFLLEKERLKPGRWLDDWSITFKQTDIRFLTATLARWLELKASCRCEWQH